MWGSLLYVTASDGTLYRFNISNSTLDSVTKTIELNDIAFDSNSNLYGVIDSNLYLVDTLSGETEQIYSFSNATNLNSLTCSVEDVLYSANIDGSISSFNLNNNTESLICSHSREPGGDLTFYDNQLLLVDNLDSIIIVDRITGELDICFSEWVLGRGVGLSSVKINCDETKIYCSINGVFDGQPKTKIFEINKSVGTIDSVFAINKFGNGSASRTEYLSSTNESLIIDSIKIVNPTCDSLNGEISIFAGGNYFDKLTYTLSNTESNSLGQFLDVGAGEYLISIIDGISCIVDTTITITCDETTSLNHNTKSTFRLYPNPASDYIIVESNIDIIDEINLYSLNSEIINTSISKIGKKILIDISGIEKGVYFIAISNREIFKVLISE